MEDGEHSLTLLPHATVKPGRRLAAGLHCVWFNGAVPAFGHVPGRLQAGAPVAVSSCARRWFWHLSARAGL